MEVGAVKQAFNNEIILLKKNLNQAKIQTIHKLTRKAKTLTEKKAPETLKDKLKRKAESAVKEVLIIKKIKARDIARFIVTHTGQLKDYLNKPEVDNNKACARLLLHKSLQDKYKHIRGKFLNISIKDLFMSRQERLKLKKEAREKKKNKKKGKELNTVNVEGEWNVEGSKETIQSKNTDDSLMSDDEIEIDNDDEMKENNDSALSDQSGDGNEQSYDESDGLEESEKSNDETEEVNNEKNDVDQTDSDSNENEKVDDKILNKVKFNGKNDTETKPNKNNKFENNTNKSNKVKLDKKLKEHKNKNLNEKLLKRKFNKESDDLPPKVTKIVDPFFITSTGGNYMSLVEPRQPDEVKESHKQGNRKYRRAVMFGHVPKIKPRKTDFQHDNNFNKQNNFNKNKSNNKSIEFGEKRNNFNRKERNNVKDDSVPEKLHPSWEAKKKQSGILPFQGKKIVFD